jgi:WD40 repeat protein
MCPTLTGGTDGTAKLWETETGRLQRVLSGHQDQVRSASCSPDGGRVVTASWDGTARLWDASTGNLLKNFPAGGPLVAAAFTPDGQRVLAVRRDGTLQVWDGGGRLLASLAAPKNARRMAFTKDGRLVLVQSEREVQVFELQALRKGPTFSGHESGAITWASFSPDGNALATAATDLAVKLWDARAGTLTRTFHLEVWPTGVEFSPSGDRLVVSVLDGTSVVWNRHSGERAGLLDRHKNGVVFARYTPDGGLIVSGGQDASVNVWNAERFEMVASLSTGSPLTLGGLLSADGTRIVTVDVKGWVFVWDIRRDDRDQRALEALVQCRVPFVMRSGNLVSTKLEPFCQ